MPVRITQEALISQGGNTGATARITQAALITQGPVPTASSRVTQAVLVTIGPNPQPGRVTQLALVTMGPYPVSLVVTPSPSSLSGVGSTLQFTASATLSDATVVNVTSQSSWTSSNTSAATINASSGLATAVASGVTTITASYGGLTATSTLTVSVVTIVSIAVTPASVTRLVGQDQQFTAIATWSDSSTTDVTAVAAWSSSSSATATVDSTGLATAVAGGSTTITATYSAVSGTASLTVIVVTSVVVTPNPVNLTNTGQTQQFTAIATWSDASTTDVTATSVWVSTSTGVATVNGTGLATSTGFGTTSIQATYSGLTGSATLNVAVTLTSIVVTPSPTTVDIGLTRQFTATGHYTDGSTTDITASVTWSSLNTAIATIAAGGLATGVSGGVVTIRATSGSIHGDASLTVAGLASITISPLNPSILDGDTQQFVATGHYTDLTTLDITALAIWSSGTTAVATIDGVGLATSHSAGDTTITASYLGHSASTNLHVNDPVLVSLTVLPANPSQAIGLDFQFAAVGTYTDGSTRDLTQLVTWSSATPAVATMGLHGLAHTVSLGTSVITAATGVLSASTLLTVIGATLVEIQLFPQNPVVPVGHFQPFQTIEVFSDGTTQDVTLTSVWSSSDVTVATIGAGTGVSQAQVVGVTIIQALVGLVSVTTLMTVVEPQLLRLEVLPADPSIPYPGTQQFQAVGFFADGSVLDLTNSVLWTSSLGSIATIDPNLGFATARHGGKTHIIATLDSISGSTILTVVPVLLEISVTPPVSLVTIGGEVQLTATGSYNDTSTADITLISSWSSAYPVGAPVTLGLVLGVSLGIATITAELDSISGTATVDVIAMAAWEDPTQKQFRSHITQELQNYFDEKDPRCRRAKYEIGAQLLNLAAMQVEQVQKRLNREIGSRTTVTSPVQLDNRGVYYAARLPHDFPLEPGVSFPGIIGRRAGQPDTLLYPYNDLLPVPSRITVDPDVDPIPMSDPVLFTMIGAGNVREALYVVNRVALGEIIPLILPPGRINLWLDGVDLHPVRLTVLIEGSVYPQPVWPGEQRKTSEQITMTTAGFAQSTKRWEKIDQITVRGLPQDARLQGWSLPFTIPVAPDIERPYTDPGSRDVLFSRFWQISPNGLVLSEQYLDDGGFEYIQSYRSPIPLSAVAVEPGTWGMFVASEADLIYLDRREPLPAQLAATGITRDPLYGLQVDHDVVASDGSTDYVTLTPIAYARAGELSMFRYIVQLPSPDGTIPGDLLVLTDAGFIAYSGGAGWRRGTPSIVSLPVTQQAEGIAQSTYLYEIECMDQQGNVSRDAYPYPNLVMTPTHRAGQDIFFPLADLVPAVRGLAFDDAGRLWVWTGSYAVALKVHYDSYILDAANRVVYLTDPFDVVDISNG